MTTTHSWIRLLHVNSRATFALAGFTGPFSAWSWIVDSMIEEHGCDEDDVGCQESDDGDLVTVRGEPMYVVAHGLPN